MTDTILVTGGAGYVGSHVVVELARAGYAPVVLDNFANSTPRCCPACRRSPAVRYRASPPTCATSGLRAVFHDHPIAAVVHCAGLKAVGESEERPLAYYDVNVGGAITLAEVMGEAGVATLVFSSSATVYGQPEDSAGDGGRAAAAPQRLRPHEARRRGFPARPRARQRELAHRDPALLQSRRRAFSGMLGESPRGAPNNLVPSVVPDRGGRARRSRHLRRRLADARRHRHSRLPARAGSGRGHAAALSTCARTHGATTLNLGAGVAHSVMEVVKAFETRVRTRITKSMARAGPATLLLLRRSAARGEDAEMARNARSRTI
jgi:UDP-glucose 4-epimerase